MEKKMCFRVLLGLFLLLFHQGCMQRSVSNATMTELLNGLPSESLKDFHYCFEGNHAGYGFLARFSATQSELDKLVSGAKDWGLQTPSYAIEGEIPEFLVEQAGAWFQLDQNQEVRVWRHTGQNRLTSEFIHFIFLLPDGKTVYVHGSGI